MKTLPLAQVKANLSRLVDQVVETDELAGLRSLRGGRSRIVYRIAARRLIDLVAIGPRRTIYQETLRLLRRR